MLELPECEENAFDGLHCPRWYGGGSCSYCGAPQPKAEPVAAGAAAVDPLLTTGRQVESAEELHRAAYGVSASVKWCPECRSAGVVGIEQDVCPTCDGTGKVAAGVTGTFNDQQENGNVR